jgi:hypothetical protein
VNRGVIICALVIAGQSRPKDGVASLAYDPAIHRKRKKVFWMDARVMPAHDDRKKGANHDT